MQTLDLRRPVGTLVTEIPHAVPVLEHHGIDFCCGGHRPFAEACARVGVDPQVVAEAIAAARPLHPATEASWADRPLDELIDHIVADYHEPLRIELPLLYRLAHKVARVHAEVDGERLGAVAEAVSELVADLVPHMDKEEQVLFPLVRAGQGGTAGAPVRVLQEDHEGVAVLLRRLRALTDGYAVPEGACGSWRRLWTGLRDLELALHAHVHLENNVLFPRALAR